MKRWRERNLEEGDSLILYSLPCKCENTPVSRGRSFQVSAKLSSQITPEGFYIAMSSKSRNQIAVWFPIEFRKRRTILFAFAIFQTQTLVRTLRAGALLRFAEDGVSWLEIQKRKGIYFFSLKQRQLRDKMTSLRDCRSWEPEQPNFGEIGAQLVNFVGRSHFP